MTLTITHTQPEGTLVDGTERGDGSAPVLKGQRFKWSRNLGMWYVPQSRHRIADRHRIDSTAEQLRAAGFAVTVEVDNSAEDPAERQQALSERAEQRAEGLTLKAERKGGEAEAAYGRWRAELDPIPPGQPILVGHHSERGHRAALRRADRAMSRSIEADRERQDAERGARAALARDRRRQTPEYIGNRIREREAEERQLVRLLADAPEGDWRTDRAARLEQVRADLDHYRGQMAALEAAGLKRWGPDDFAKGDRVRYRHRWGTVQRVNKTTLTVACDVMPQCPQRVPYSDIQSKGEGA